jgi:hypothetical protein
MTQTTSRQLALGSLALLILFYVLTLIGFFGPNQIGQSGQDNNPLVVPAGYAFAIWGPIYLGLLLFPIYQYVVKRENDEHWIPLRKWYAANVVANGLWLVAASYNWLWTTVLIITFMLFSLVKIRQLFREITMNGSDYNYWAEKLVFSLYFAWVTLATALNVSSALYFYDWNGFGLDPVIWSLIILSVAAGIAFLVARHYRDPAYAAVVVWAFCALVIRHWASIPTLAYFSLAVAVLFTVVTVWYLLEKRTMLLDTE